ncbi:hypothetical protein HUJ04_005445 [Dendroctonus ponderosae]|nr:hypothetical protein HUJ04_005445 [Dendroctonus ponderosae]
MLTDEQIIDSVTSSTALSDNEKDDDLGLAVLQYWQLARVLRQSGCLVCHYIISQVGFLRVVE